MRAMFDFGGAFRRLRRSDAAVYLDHLRRLSPTDRRRRFHSARSDAGLATHVSRIVAEAAGVTVIGWFSGGRLCGSVEIAIWPERGALVAEAAFVVAPDHRGRGVGAELMARAVRFARDRGVETLRFETHADNRPMLRLCLAQGARIDVMQDGDPDGPPRAIASIAVGAVDGAPTSGLVWATRSAAHALADYAGSLLLRGTPGAQT